MPGDVSAESTAASSDVVLDTEGMFELTAGLPEQIERAVSDTRQVGALPESALVENVVVMGMGGSAMAGEIVAAAGAPLLPVPVAVVRDYECPAYVGPETLVFAVSASGDTEETVQAASDAFLAGATMVVVSGDGRLADLADSWVAPRIPVPPIPEPRAALGAMAIPPLVVLESMGLYRGGQNWIEAAVEQLKRRRDALVAAGEGSPAADVARAVGRTLALVHGGGAVGSAAALRWKTQINENAKAPAFYASQPELCHNEICGWGQHGDVTRQVLTALFLRHDAEHPQVGTRFALVGELLREVVADVVEVRAEGDGDLAQLLDLILFGDYVSLWMAAFAGVDPGPVPVLTDLKTALAGP